MKSEEIRTEIKATLSRLFRKNGGVRIVEELEICSGKARADIAIITDELIGIEIKGPMDRLNRLPNQILQYSKVFDRVILVVDESHSTNAIALIPSWWGIVLFTRDANNRLKLLRRPTRNRLADLDTMLSLLWRPEIERLFWQMIGETPPSRASKPKLRKELLSQRSPLELKTAIIDTLKKRQNWRSFSAQATL